MSDIEKKPEQSVDAEPTEKIEDLPTKAIADEDAAAVKGGELSLSYGKVKFVYTENR